MGLDVQKVSGKVVTCKADIATNSVTSTANVGKVYRNRFVYNVNVKPAEVDALMAKRVRKSDGRATEALQVRGRTVWSSVNSACDGSSCVKLIGSKDVSVEQGETQQIVTLNQAVAANIPKTAVKVISSPGVSVDDTFTAETVSKTLHSNSEVTAEVISAPGGKAEGHTQVSEAPTERGSVNYGENSITKSAPDNSRPIYDVNSKFVNSILHVNQFSGIIPEGDTKIYHKWRGQSEFQFGFIPLGDQILPEKVETSNSEGLTPLEMHRIVRETNKPNYMEARLPVKSQLKVDTWKRHLQGYWDEQLLQLIEFGFPLLGPFDSHPIASGHCSPFMSRVKPNSDSRRIIIDLSWPLGASVNAGIDKTSYLGSPFSLTFPIVDDITAELTRLGRGALLFKVDVSRASGTSK